MSIPVVEPLYGATPGQALRRFLRGYARFTGRASRSEFWWTYLFLVLAVLALGLVGTVLGALTATPADQAAGRAGLGVIFAPITILLLVLGVILPLIALVVRRLHDANLSGLLALLWLVPYVGGLVVLILCILPTQPLGRRFDPGAGYGDPAAPQSYGAFGASPYGQPVATVGTGRPGAADLSHALAQQLMAGVGRDEVGATARRFGATRIDEDADVQRFVMPDADVVVEYDASGRMVRAGVDRG